MNNKAVLIIGMLNDFVTGDLKCERAKHIIPNLKKLTDAARKHNIQSFTAMTLIILRILKLLRNGENTP